MKSIHKQILIWIVYTLFWIFVVYDDFTSWVMILEVLLFILLGHGIIFYTNYYGLMPKLFMQKKYLLYILSSILVLLVWFATCRYLVGWMFQEQYWEVSGFWKGEGFPMWTKNAGKIMIMRFSASGIIIFLSSLIAYNTDQVRKKEQKILALENEKLNAEMRLMRMQINPHFLFNALNNIYSRAILNPDQVAEAIHKLSGLLRYALYDCDTDKIALTKEVDYLQNYIDLQRLKDEEIGDIKFEVVGDLARIQVLPMVLVAFVENSFKHSNIEQNGWIHMRLSVQKNILVFECKNSIAPRAKQKDKTAGIGLANVQKRLELIYPNAHELHIIQKETLFSIYLKIELNEN